MRIIDRLKYDGPNDVLAWKHPAEDIRIGTKLIVNMSQEAVFLKGGSVCDCFGPGAHTLTTKNLPLLDKLINLPFGGKTPFSAEVIYVNKATNLALKWGTPDPIRLTDPFYNVILKASGNGTFGIRVSDPVRFLKHLVGTANSWNSDDIKRYFKGEIIQRSKSVIAQVVIKERVSLTEINAHLDDIANKCHQRISGEFEKYGLNLATFRILSLSIPDESIKELESIMIEKARIQQLGKDYDKKRSYDVLEKTAENPSKGGVGLSNGLGLGLGLGAGVKVGSQLGQNISEGINNATKEKQKLGTKCACGYDLAPNTKFCSNCGKPVQKQRFCHDCGAELVDADAQFCSECGKQL